MSRRVGALWSEHGKEVERAQLGKGDVRRDPNRSVSVFRDANQKEVNQ